MDWNYAEEEKACISAMQHCFGPIYSAVLNAAIELNLFEIIAKESPTGVGVTASDVASQLPTQHPEFDRMLSLLATHSLLTCSTRTYENGEPQRFYHRSHVVSSQLWELQNFMSEYMFMTVSFLYMSIAFWFVWLKYLQ